MKTKTYFEPTSRLQLLDKLRHMVRFSDFLLMISGAKGAGKTALVEQIVPEPGDTTLCCLLVKNDSVVNEQQLLDILLQQLPSHDQGGTGFADHLKLFYLQIKALKSAGRKCLIVVDDAEKLSKSALELLLGLHQSDDSASGAQLLLLADDKFAEAFLQSPAVKSLDGRYHHQPLAPLTNEEVLEYLEVCHPDVNTLAQKKKQQLIHLSQGLPGRIESLLSGEKVAPAASPAAKVFPLPGMHMAGIGLVLLAILAVSLWQFFPEDQQEQTVSQASNDTLSLPLPVAVLPEQEEHVEAVRITENPVKSEPHISAEPSQVKQALNERLAEQEAKLQQKEIAQPSSAEEKEYPLEKLTEELKEVVQLEAKPVVEPAEEVDAPPSVTKAQPIKNVVKEEKVVVQNAGNNPAEADILSWAKTGYTLQMLGARSEKSALEFIRAQKEPSKFHHFSTIYKGAPWHVVIYGQYANRDIANASIKKLPPELQKIKPWARSVQGVQLDIKKK